MPDTERQGARETAPRRVRGVANAFTSADSYGLVLILIVVSYALSVSLSATWTVSLLIGVQIATVWFALRTSRSRPGVRIVAGVLVVLSGVVGAANVFWPSTFTQRGLVALTAGVLYLIAPLSILRHLVVRRVIDAETLIGALAAYLLWGMCFAFFYNALGHIQSDPFFGTQGDGTFPQDLFYSFTTITTTGYGNLVAAGNPGQSLAVLEMLLGQFFLVTAVGKIVSAWRPRRLTGDGPAQGELPASD